MGQVRLIREAEEDLFGLNLSEKEIVKLLCPSGQTFVISRQSKRFADVV